MIVNSLIKSKYKPSLDEFISQCEANYALILKLLPRLKLKKSGRLPSELKPKIFEKHSIKLRPLSGHKVDLQLVEEAKYTTTMMIMIHSPSRSADADIKLMIRLYHDAQLLEVMDQNGPKALEPVNKGTDLLDKQVDEKRQLNRFIGESLKICLQDHKGGMVEDDDYLQTTR